MTGFHTFSTRLRASALPAAALAAQSIRRAVTSLGFATPANDRRIGGAA